MPTLIHDGKVLTESTVINEYLDETFPEVPLRPEDTYLRAKLRLWTKREDSIHYAINTMTTAIIFRPELLKKSLAEQTARIDGIPDPSRRAKFHELMQTGLESKGIGDSREVFSPNAAELQQLSSASRASEVFSEHLLQGR